MRFPTVQNTNAITALKDYEGRVYSHARELAHELEAHVNTPIIMNAWAEQFTFQVMGDIIFGQQWHLLKDKKGRYHDVIALHAKAIGTLGPMTPVPWLFRVIFSIPTVQEGWRFFRSWAVEECDKMVDVS